MSHFGVPPLRPENAKSKEKLSWIEEYLEGKDEILLYITAALGVFLPGIVYLLYHKCHAYYERYSKRKEAEKLAEELAQSEASVIVLGDGDGKASAWGKKIHEKLSEEMVRKPYMWTADTMNVKDLQEFKGFCVFVVDTLAGGQPTPSTEWILEWLEDMAANAKMKKRANFELIRFVIVGFGSSSDGPNLFNKVSRTLLKRLKIVGSKQILEVEIYDSEADEIAESRFEPFIDELLDAMDRHLPGAENYSDSEEIESETDGEQSIDEDGEDYNRKKKAS